MKKLLSTLVVLFLIGTLNVQGQERRLNAYAIGFYNLENLFDTEHDEGHNDYEYLPEGRNKWTEMKYQHKLRNMSRVLAEMGTDKLPYGCAAIGVSEVENARCMADLCAQEPLKARNYQFCHVEGPDQRGVDCALIYNPSQFTVRDVKLVPYIYKEQEDIEKGRATRGFLVVSGTLADEHVTIIVNHLPSRFSESFYREEGGRQIRLVKDSLLRDDPDVKIDTAMRLPARYKNFGGKYGEIKDDHGGWDSLTLKQVIEQSSNVGMSELGWMYYNNRRDTLRAMVEKMFPYGKMNPDVVAPEYKTYVNNLNASNRDFLNFCYGYSTRVSALQLITFYNALGAGGRMVKPLFCRAVIDNDGSRREIKPVVLNERMCGKRTAALMHDMLEGVVENGTGNNIKNTTYGIAGKTGTAVHSYSNMRRYNASFAGFFPSENPRYTCLVMLENIPVYGRQAAVVFKTISDCVVAVDKSLSDGAVKSVWPRLEEDSAMAQQRPTLTKGRADDIRDLYKRFRIPFVCDDSVGTWVAYSGGDSLPGRYVAYEPASGRMPNCYGMTAKDAIALLHEQGYKVKVNGYGKVRSQSPKASQAAKKGTTVVLDLR